MRANRTAIRRWGRLSGLCAILLFSMASMGRAQPLLLDAPTPESLLQGRAPLIPVSLSDLDPSAALRQYRSDSLGFDRGVWATDSLAAEQTSERAARIDLLLHRGIADQPSPETAERWLRERFGSSPERLAYVAGRLRELGYNSLATRLHPVDSQEIAVSSWFEGVQEQYDAAFRRFERGDTTRAATALKALTVSLDGLDTLQAVSLARLSAGDVRRRAEQLRESALAAGMREGWLRAETLRRDANALLVWADQLLAEGSVATRVLPEAFLRDYVPGRMDTVGYSPLREAELVEAVRGLRLRAMQLELNLAKTVVLPSAPVPLNPQPYQRELTRALVLRDEARLLLGRLESGNAESVWGQACAALSDARAENSAEPLKRWRESAQRDGGWQGLPARDRAALLLQEAELLSRGGNGNVGREIAELLAVQPGVDPNQLAQRSRLLADAELAQRRPAFDKALLLRWEAASTSAPGEMPGDLLAAGSLLPEIGGEEWGDRLRAHVAVAVSHLPGMAPVTRDRNRKCAAELLVQTVPASGEGWDALQLCLKLRPEIQLQLDGELELAFVRYALPEPDTSPTLLPMLERFMASQPRPDRLCEAKGLHTEVIERSGGSVETSWVRRRDQMHAGLPGLEGGSRGSLVVGAGLQRELVRCGEELVSIAVQQLREGRFDSWAERAIESLHLFDRTGPDSTQLAQLRFVLADALAKSKDDALRLRGITLLVETAEGWNGEYALRAAETAHAQITEWMKQNRERNSELEALFVRSAKRRVELLGGDEEAQATLLNTGISLLRVGSDSLALGLFEELVNRWPDGVYRAEGEEGLFEALLGLGRWRAVQARRDSLLAAGEGGRIATVADNALGRMEVLQARQLRESGLPEQALEALERAGGLDADPTLSAAALLEAGRMFADDEQWDRARETFEGVTELYPGQAAANRALYNLAVLRESEIESEGREPSREEHFEIAQAFLKAASANYEGELSRSALASAADHARLGGDEPLELQALSLLLRYHVDHPGVRALLGRAGRLAWRAGEMERAHELYLELTRRAPQSSEAVAAFVFLADEAERDGKLEDARWAWTMAVRAESESEATGQVGDRAMAQQAELALAQSHRTEFLNIHYTLPPDRLRRSKERKRTLGEELIALYEKPASSASVAGLCALFGIAEVEQALAQAVQFQPEPEGLAPESLAVRSQSRALEAWAHRHAAIQALQLVWDRSQSLAAMLDSASSEKETGEFSDPIGLEADALRRGVSPDPDLLDRLRGQAADEILRQYDLSIIAQDDLLRSFAELPSRGDTPLQKATYRLALIDQFLRPRMLFLTELKLEANRAAKRYGRDPSFAGALFSHLLTPQGAASESITQMEIDLPRILAKYDSLIGRRDELDSTGRARLGRLPDLLYDHQDLAVRYAKLDIDIVREQLERVAQYPEYTDDAMQRAKLGMEAALEHTHEMDRHAQRSREAASTFADLYESEHHSLLREAVQLHEDLAQRWSEGAFSLLEPAWAIAAESGFRPQPETDEIARELARRDPSEYAYVLGLKERSHNAVSDGSWTWGATAETSPERETAVGETLAGWSGTADARTPHVIEAEKNQRTVWFRGTVNAPGTLSSGELQIIASRPYEAYLNGRFAAETLEPRGFGEQPESWDVGDLLREGENVILVRLSGGGVDSQVAIRLNWKTVGVIDDSMKAHFAGSGNR